MNRNGIILELQPRDGGNFCFSKMTEDVSNRRPVDLSQCEVSYVTSIIDSFRPEFIDYIVKHGITSLINRRPLTEAVVPPGAGSTVVESLLQAFVAGISVTTDLVIVDPYFLAPTSDTTYPHAVEQILRPVLATLQTLTIIGLPSKADANLLASISSTLGAAAPALTVIHKTSNQFHDRFWINPVAATGFLTGSSLNGLGKKYAIVDYLQAADVSDILDALRNESLL